MPQLDTLTVRLEADAGAFNAALATADQRVKTFGTTGKSAEQVAKDMVAQMRAQAQTTAQTTTATVASTVATRTSSVATRHLTRQMTALAASTLPVNTGVLRLSSTLGALVASGGIMVAVTAGATLLGIAWDYLTQDARELKEATDESVKSLREMRLEAETLGDIKLIQELDPAQRTRDQLRAQIDAIEENRPGARRRSLTGEFWQDRLARLKEEYAELDREVRFGEAQLAKRRADRQARDAAEAAKASAARIAAAQRAVAGEAKSAEERVAALTTLVHAGRATTEQTEELQAAAVRLRAVFADTSAPEAQARALAQLTKIQEANTAAKLRALAADRAAAGIGTLADIGPAGAARNPALGPGGTLLRAPREIGFRVTQPVEGQAAGGFLASITSQLQLVPQMMVASLATSALSAVTSKLFEGIGSIFGGGESKQEEAARLQIEAANRQMRAAQDQLRATFGIQNLPMSFNAGSARARIGAGGGGVNVNGNVIIQASPTGDTPAALWTKFERAMKVAAAGGNVQARSMVLG